MAMIVKMTPSLIASQLNPAIDPVASFEGAKTASLMNEFLSGFS
jgi:hypothetical protein